VLCFSVDSSPIQVFDYNGDYLHPFKINGGPQADSIGVASLAIDEQDRMYLADEMGVRILCCNLSGDYVSGFSILDGLKDKVRREQMLGAIHLDGDLIYVSTPMIGSVYCYNKQGTLVKMVGRNGGGYGELAFPTAVSTDVQGNVLVLDKHRHMVISYDSTGKVNGEFGGLGRNPGWFYHPTAMLVDTRNRVWVAQGFRNLLQVLQLPLPEETAPAPKERTIVVDR
jgi:hypothetical protein